MRCAFRAARQRVNSCRAVARDPAAAQVALPAPDAAALRRGLSAEQKQLLRRLPGGRAASLRAPAAAPQPPPAELAAAGAMASNAAALASRRAAQPTARGSYHVQRFASSKSRRSGGVGLVCTRRITHCAKATRSASADTRKRGSGSRLARAQCRTRAHCVPRAPKKRRRTGAAFLRGCARSSVARMCAWAVAWSLGGAGVASSREGYARVHSAFDVLDSGGTFGLLERVQGNRAASSGAGCRTKTFGLAEVAQGIRLSRSWPVLLRP